MGMRDTSTGETALFVSNVILDGSVENWLVGLEMAMLNSMQKLLSASIQAHRGKHKEKWINYGSPLIPLDIAMNVVESNDFL